MRGWVAFDLDGTLAIHDGWKGIEHIGAPIPAMIERVKAYRRRGVEVRIFTARISDPDKDQRAKCREAITAWCREHIGEEFLITCIKDFRMIRLYDDRAVGVETNTGRIFTVVGEDE